MGGHMENDESERQMEVAPDQELTQDTPGGTPPDEPDEPTTGDDEPDDDDDDEQPDEPEAVAPQAAGPSDTDFERGLQKIGNSFKTYERSVANNYPTFEADLTRCLLCPDAHPGFLNVHDAGRVPKDVSDAVQWFLGIARPVELRQAPDTRTCGTCDGEGKVYSGSRVPQHKERTCPVCRGYGFEPPPGAPQNGTVVVPDWPSMEDAATQVIATEDEDEWHEPRLLPDGRENPNFGKMPSRKILVQPWGVTAGLVAQDA